MKPRPWPSSVIHLADYGGPYPGNFISSLIALKQSLAVNGIRQSFVFSTSSANKKWFADLNADRNNRVYLLDKHVSFPVLVNNICHIVLKERGTILHTHFTSFDVGAFVGQIALNRLGHNLKTVCHVHSDFPIKLTLVRRLKDLIKFHLLGRAVTYLCVSRPIFEGLASRGMNPSQGKVIFNGIDMNRARHITASPDELATRYGCTNKSKRILLFGWSPVIKGVDVAIDACARLACKRGDFELLIAGTDDTLKFLHKHIGEQFPPWLRVLPPSENVGDLYSLADYFLSSSRSEGFSYSIGEAMAACKPVIVSELPSMEWTQGAPGCFYFEPSNSNDLAERINQLLDLTSAEQMNLGSKNADFIARNHSIENWTKQLLAIYLDLCGVITNAGRTHIVR